MGALISLALRLAGVGGKFVVMLVLAHFAGAREVGEFALFFGAINVALFVIGLDFHLFAIRELLSRRTRGARARVMLGQAALDGSIYLLIVIGAALATLLGLSRFVPVSLFWFVSILVLDHIAQEVSRQLLVLREAHASNFVYAAKTGLWGWVGGAAIFAGGMAPSARSFYLLWALADCVAIIGGLAILFRLLGGVRTSLPPNILRWIVRGLKISRYFYVTSIATMCIAYLDRFIIARQVSLEETGKYAFWQSITSLIPVVVYAMAGMHYLPRLVEAYRQGREGEFRLLAREFKIKTMGISAACGVVILVLSSWLPGLIGKAEFSAGIVLILLLVGGAAMNAAWQVPYQVLYSAGDDRYLAVVLTSFTAATVMLDLALIPLAGIVGAAGVALAVNASVYSVLDRRATRHHEPSTADEGAGNRCAQLTALVSSPSDG